MTDALENLPILVDRLVCFIDILGFADLVQQASNENQDAIIRIDSALKAIQTVEGKITHHKGSRPAVHIFSDSVIISATPDNNAVLALCKAMAELTWELLKAGVFIRGGLAVGKVSSDKTRPWGPAIVKAYRMESTVANVPRIVAHRSVLKLLDEDGLTMLNSLLRRDTEDGVYFIDSLSYQIKGFENGSGTALENDLETIRDYLNSEHKRTIDNPRVYEKINWFRDLWDEQFEHQDSKFREYRTEHGKAFSLLDAINNRINF